MSDSRIETAAYSSRTFEQRASPVRFESINNDDVFNLTRRSSHSERNMAQDLTEASFASASSQHGFVHLEAAQRASSSNAIDQLVNQQYQRNGSSSDIDQSVNHQYHRTASTDMHQYPINEDPTPEHVRRGNNDRITYRQDVAIRYLQPPTPPPPGPVIVREIRAPQAPEAPPLIIRQRPPAPVTPPPVIIRERPPMPPPIEPPRIVNKYLPAPPLPPRKVIIERQAALPEKPQPVIIEKWLPYRPAPERRVVVERAAPIVPRPTQKNTIITWDAPRVDLVKNVRELGTIRADPNTYAAQYGSQLASSDYVLNTMTRYGLGNNYAQMMQLHSQQHAALLTSQNHQASIAFGENSASSLHESHVGDQYDYMEKHSRETVLPDGRRQFRSSISGSDEQEVLRQATLGY